MCWHHDWRLRCGSVFDFQLAKRMYSLLRLVVWVYRKLGTVLLFLLLWPIFIFEGLAHGSTGLNVLFKCAAIMTGVYVLLFLSLLYVVS